MSVTKLDENLPGNPQRSEKPSAVKPWWVDARDVLAILGVSLLGYGFWRVDPALGCIVPGSVLTYLALFGVRG